MNLCVCVCAWWSGTAPGCVSVISRDERAQRDRGGGESSSVTSSQRLFLWRWGTSRPSSPCRPLHPVSVCGNESRSTVADSACRHGRRRPPESKPSSDTLLGPLSAGIEHLGSCRGLSGCRCTRGWTVRIKALTCFPLQQRHRGEPTGRGWSVQAC